MLSRSTVALPDPERKKRGSDYDEETQRKILEHIEECMTDLVAQLDEDDALLASSNPNSSDDPYLSLVGLRSIGNDKCGYESLRPADFDGSAHLYELNSSTGTGPNAVNNSNNVNNATSAPKYVTKSLLTTLGIQSIKRYVERISELSHICPNGTAASIQSWARIAFTDRNTGILDETQKRAFEVIASTVILTFHEEAENNENTGEISTPPPWTRHVYKKTLRQLKTLTGMAPQEKQLLMFLTGAGGSGKSEVINSVLAYVQGFCKELSYPFDKRTIVVTALTGVAMRPTNR